MFSKTSYRSLKHKAKKGVLKKIGMTEDKQEDSVFHAVLFSVEQFKKQLRDIHFKAKGLANAGNEYNNALEYLCGSGLKGEQLFNKEHMFIDALRDCLCKVLTKVLETDIPKMDELVLSYEAAKLAYDKAYYQAVKEMKKKEVDGFDCEEYVLKYSDNAAETRKIWLESKKAVVTHRNVLKGRLDNEVVKALEEVKEVSDADHHRLYGEYFKERILITSAMCTSGTVSARNTAVPISRGNMSISSVDDEQIEDRKQDTVVHGMPQLEEHPIEDESKTEVSDSNTIEKSAGINPAENTEVNKPPASNKISEIKSAEDNAVEESPVGHVSETIEVKKPETYETKSSENYVIEVSPDGDEMAAQPLGYRETIDVPTPTSHEDSSPPQVDAPPTLPVRQLPPLPPLAENVIAGSPPARLPPPPPVFQGE